MTAGAKIDGLNVLAFDSIEAGAEYIILNCMDSATSAIALNPEKVMKARESRQTRELLERADILYPDGIGIVKVLESKLNKSLARIPGCDLWEELMRDAAAHDIPVYLLGARDEILSATVTKLKTEYSTPIVGYHEGYYSSEDEIINEIRESRAKIISVALGSPKQEQFIFKCIDSGINAFFMGVGGTYDVYSGYVKRAPLIFRNMNLEWLYRLVTQPSRFFRQLKLLKYIWLYTTKQL